MKQCKCDERIETRINTWNQFVEWKDFFEKQIGEELFLEVPVKRPYHIGYSANGNEMKWCADKWYKCLECDTLWEFIYPDFPAQGSVKKYSANDCIHYHLNDSNRQW